MSPDEPDVLNYLGYSWIDRGVDLKDAKAMIEKAVAAKPDSGAIVDSLGWADYKLGLYADAVEQLERATELEPADPDINNHLGRRLLGGRPQAGGAIPVGAGAVARPERQTARRSRGEAEDRA